MARFGQRREREAGRARHAFVEQRRRAAARFGDQPRAARMRRHQRRFRGRERDIEITAREQAVDAQRADHADRNFHGADEVLDVAAVGFAVVEAGRIGDAGARLGRIGQEAPALVDHVQLDAAAAGDGGWRRLEMRPQALGVGLIAIAYDLTQELGNPPVICRHAPIDCSRTG